MKKIAVIGANGYIGSNLSIFLQRKFYKLFKEEAKIKYYGHQEMSDFLNYKQIDATDINSTQTMDLNVDVIFFLIGKTGTFDGFQNPMSYINLNEKALLNILTEHIRQKSNARIIFPSTRLVYKGSKKKIKEEASKESKTIYAATKLAAENFLQIYNKMFDIPYTIFRICVPYGNLTGVSSCGTYNLFKTQAIKNNKITLYGNGSLRRTWTHIEDICEIMTRSAFLEETKNKIFNIGGEDFSLKEIANLMAKRYNAKIEYTDWPTNAKKIESGNTVFDDNKLRNLGIFTKIKFADWIYTNEENI